MPSLKIAISYHCCHESLVFSFIAFLDWGLPDNLANTDSMPTDITDTVGRVSDEAQWGASIEQELKLLWHRSLSERCSHIFDGWNFWQPHCDGITSGTAVKHQLFQSHPESPQVTQARETHLIVVVRLPWLEQHEGNYLTKTKMFLIAYEIVCLAEKIAGPTKSNVCMWLLLASQWQRWSSPVYSLSAPSYLRWLSQSWQMVIVAGQFKGIMSDMRNWALAPRIQTHPCAQCWKAKPGL